ncbi:MAG: ABC transporter permease [Thaumarchaeota archaeon]|nr:ABC transporter permease [Candidatus Calditenuaceae archaeon]MDW8186838.1 ABC transporter permease [Nitrososphaerota archaeon]
MKIPNQAVYLARRALVLMLTVIAAVYITILVANMGGYVDEIVKSELLFQITTSVRQNPAFRGLNETAFNRLVNQLYEQRLEQLGLNQPFFVRSIIYMRDALTLDLGRALFLTSDSGSKSVRLIILERLPSTILLFTTIQLMLFFIGLLGGLFLSRRYGTKTDRVLSYLATLSAFPGWFYGIFLILVFASWLRVLPYGGMVDIPPPEDRFLYALSVLKHMVLPMMSWLVAYSFFSIYTRRTFFLIYSSEDFVEVAKAKGIPEPQVRRRYILRPTLPPIVTDFSLTLVASWTGAIVTETVFNWPGTGRLFFEASVIFDTPVLVGLVVIYAYLVAVTVFILELVYALLDPRIRTGGS